MDATAEGPAPEGCRVKLGEFELVAGQGEVDSRGPCKVTIRPERVQLMDQGTTGENTIPAMVERVVYVGSVLQVILNLAAGRRIQAWIHNEGGTLPYGSGAAVAARMPREALRVLPESGSIADIEKMEELGE
jgi:ABC-type sulfate/molybdate transport systems ATPase subunit